MVDFPSYPFLVDEGFGIDRGSVVSRTSMDDGMVKQLKTKSRALVTRRVKYGMRTLADYQSFITWFEDDINGGADWFNWTDPVSSTVKTARIVSKLELEEPFTPMLTQWTVSFQIETFG